MSAEEFAGLTTQAMGNFPIVCLCARFMLMVVRQNKMSNAYVWEALTAVTWLFLVKMISASVGDFFRSLYMTIDSHLLLGALSLLFSLPFYIAFIFAVKNRLDHLMRIHPP